MTSRIRLSMDLLKFQLGQGEVVRASLITRISIFLALLTVAIVHYLLPPGTAHWLYVVQRFYYLPIVFAGLTGGWRLGLFTAVLASVCFAIGTPAVWTVPAANILDQCLEMMVFCLVGLVSGVLTDRERRQKVALHKATLQLHAVYQELQENFERMKRAEKLSALGQLSAGLAHEIRNPLASIDGAARVVQRETHSEERRREFLEIIQKECRRLNGLLTNFLNFARPRQLSLQLVDVEQLVESVLVLARHAGTQHELSLESRIPAKLPKLECDPEQIKQVLLNLVMNAIQAMPAGGLVRVDAHAHASEMNIDVHDHGPGIHAADVDRIFDPFFTTKEGGSGLGLSVAHQILTQHGGSLTIARNSKDGATLRIALPLRQET